MVSCLSQEENCCQHEGNSQVALNTSTRRAVHSHGQTITNMTSVTLEIRNLMITHSPGSIFCFSAHHFMLCECLPPCLKLLSTAFCINHSFLDHSYQDTSDLLSFLKLYLKYTSLRYGLYTTYTSKHIKQSLSKYTAMNNISQSSLCPCGTALSPDINPS